MNTARAEDGTPPRHWTTLLETVTRMRALLEEADFLAVDDGPIALSRINKDDRARMERIREDVGIIIRRPEIHRNIINHLVGEGKADAGPFLRDFKVLQLRRDSKRYDEILKEMGYPQLEDALGFSVKDTPEKQYFLGRVRHEIDRISRFHDPAMDVFNKQNRLKRGSTHMERAAFILAMLMGLSVGNVAFHAANYVGLRNLPVEKVAASIAAGATTTVGGFNNLWPMVQEKMSKIFLRRRYNALVEACAHLLKFDLETALPFITHLAEPTGKVIQASEDAALDALFQFQHPETTEALLNLGVTNLRKGFTNRADKIFRKIVERDAHSEAGQLAAAARTAISEKREFEKGLFGHTRRYITRNVRWAALGLGAVLGSVLLFDPGMLTITQAVVLHGVGFAGARALFHRFWPGYPEEKLTEEMRPASEQLTAALVELMDNGRKVGRGRGRYAIDPRRFSIDTVVALAKSEQKGNNGYLLRSAARDALHQFDDDLAMSFLIINAQKEILDQSIQQREPSTKVQVALDHAIDHTVYCLGQLMELGLARPPREVTAAVAAP